MQSQCADNWKKIRRGVSLPRVGDAQGSRTFQRKLNKHEPHVPGWKGLAARADPVLQCATHNRGKNDSVRQQLCGLQGAVISPAARGTS